MDASAAMFSGARPCDLLRAPLWNFPERMELNTFSVVARCPRTAMIGITIATAVPAAAGLTSFIKAGVGGVVTQSWVNPYLGIDGLDQLSSGASATETVARLVAADPGRAFRQIGIVDRTGGSASYTGTNCTEWAGEMLGDGFAVQGNMLTGPDTLEAMAAVMEGSSMLPLPDRLLRALEAGQAAGGDKRGRQSAALKVLHFEEYPYLDIRVDDHADPVVELRRLFGVVNRQLLPLTERLPTRTNPLREIPAAVAAMLARPPGER